jgi:hypothetical protein
MRNAEVAAAMGVSLATAKRLIAKAQRLFDERARRRPELDRWLEPDRAEEAR